MGLEQILVSIVDWFIEAAPIIGAVGGFIGGVGAVVAIFFLWRNLVQIRHQIRFQNKGFLVVDVKKISGFSSTPESGIEYLNISYHFLPTGRVPLIVKTAEWKTTEKKRDRLRKMAEESY